MAEGIKVFRKGHMRKNEAVSYYIDFSIHQIPFVTSIAGEAGGTIYTDSATTYDFVVNENPQLHVMHFDSVEKIKKHMKEAGVRVIVYPDYHIRFFKGMEGVRHVLVFHGPNDKVYQYQKDVLDYDLFFICGADAYGKYEKRGLLRKDSGVMIGYPKLDRVFRGELERARELVKLGLDPARKTVLYAPTWVDKEFNSSWKKFKDLFVGEIPEGMNVIIKLHPNLKKYREREVAEFKERLTEYEHARVFELMPDAIPLMAASDILLSDVSGVTREYLAFRRPFVFLSNRPQWLWSKKKTLMWECGEVVSRPEKMWRAIEDALRVPDRYLSIIEKHFQNTFYKPDGFAARRAKEAILGLVEQNPC
jgi:CDP-glycerol glycerophosphotransferase (TagB/SpsB family)